MNVLVLNCGSSSIKFQLIATDLEAIERDADRELARGLVERIGSEAILTLRVQGKTPERLATPLRDHPGGSSRTRTSSPYTWATAARSAPSAAASRWRPPWGSPRPRGRSWARAAVTSTR